MDTVVIEDWLKTTIPGIVVLGAAGSVLAAGVLWVVGKHLPPVAKSAFDAVLKRVVKHFVKPSVTQAVRLHFLDTKYKVESFQTLQLMKFFGALFAALCAFATFLVAVVAQPEPQLRAVVLLPLILFFLGIWSALRTMAIIAVPLFFDVETHISRAKTEIPAKLASPPES